MRDLYSLSRWFKKRYPQYAGVRRREGVERKHGMYGYCVHQSSGTFLVVIDKKICESGCIAWLIHEVAHALSFYTDEEAGGHGLAFAVAYHSVYESYTRWIDS